MCMPKMPTIAPTQQLALPEPVKPIETVQAVAKISDAPPPAEKSALYVGESRQSGSAGVSTRRQSFSSLRIPLMTGLNVPQ